MPERLEPPEDARQQTALVSSPAVNAISTLLVVVWSQRAHRLNEGCKHSPGHSSSTQ